MRKQDKERFIRKANEFIESLGATADGDYWILETKYGRLRLHATDNALEGPGTVFTRFEEPERAKDHLDCNPYSGKWNHHYFNGWTVEAALENLEWNLVKVIPEPEK